MTNIDDLIARLESRAQSWQRWIDDGEPAEFGYAVRHMEHHQKMDNEAAAALREQQAEIARLQVEIESLRDGWGKVQGLRDGWRRECDDADTIIAGVLRLHPDAYRTDGGSLNVPYIVNAIKVNFVQRAERAEAERDAAMKDAKRYQFWRKHYSSRFVIVLAPGLVCGTDLKFDATRPKVEAAGPDYERKVDAAIDAAMKEKP